VFRGPVDLSVHCVLYTVCALVQPHYGKLNCLPVWSVLSSPYTPGQGPYNHFSHPNPSPLPPLLFSNPTRSFACCFFLPYTYLTFQCAQFTVCNFKTALEHSLPILGHWSYCLSQIFYVYTAHFSFIHLLSFRCSLCASIPILDFLLFKACPKWIYLPCPPAY